MMRATALTAVMLAGIAAAFALLQSPGDSDLFWHLSSGEWTLQNGQPLDHDVWSFTRTGVGYNTGAWLGDVAMALAYRAGSWIGIDVLRAALVGVAALFTARVTLRVQPHPAWAAMSVLAAVLVSRMVWGDRPQLFTLALFPVALDVMFAARLEGHVRRLAALPIAFALWANLHNAFVVGLVALAVFAIDAWLERDARSRVPFALALVASVFATQLNPVGAGAIGRAAAYGALLPGWIVEDRALDILSGAGLVFAVLLLASLAAALVLGRERIAARLGAPLLWPGLIAPFAVLALAIQRETPYACVVLAPVAAALVPEALGRARAVAPIVTARAVVAFAGAVVLALALEAAFVAPREPDLSAYPAGALAPLASVDGHVLNEYDWGGYLIRYAPEHPTFIDGRGEALFLPDVLDDFQRAVALAPGYRDVLTRWDIRGVLLRPDRPLAGALREDGWRVVASATNWVLLSRP